MAAFLKMTHDEILKALPAETRRAMLERSDAAGLRHLAGHAAAIVVTGSLIALRIPFWPLLLPVQGVLLVFLFTLQHECTHQSPFRTKMLNETVGHLAGFMIFQPFLWFRYFHLAHHRHTNDPARDPELLAGAKPATKRSFLWHITGLSTWLAWVRRLIQNAFLAPDESYLPERALPRVQLEARAMLAGYALLLMLAGPWLVWVWLLPMVLGQPFLRLYLLAEHGRCPHVANMLENTRTTFTTRMVRFVAWNMPYHIEHHSAPNVPFHQLPALHREMRAHLISTSPGYIAFTRSYVGKLQG